jgi:hypothetical protein
MGVEGGEKGEREAKRHVFNDGGAIIEKRRSR